MKTKTVIKETTDETKLVINYAILILAELRTHYALLRTGIALFTFPITFIAFLVATASIHHIFEQPLMSMLIIGMLGGTATSGVLQLLTARKKIDKSNKLLNKIKKKHPDIAPWLI